MTEIVKRTERALCNIVNRFSIKFYLFAPKRGARYAFSKIFDSCLIFSLRCL